MQPLSPLKRSGSITDASYRINYNTINKIKRVKELQRYSNNKLCWRKYGSAMALEGAQSEIFDQINNSKDQIYGFILCQKFGLKIETLLEKYKEFNK